ncbi:MAG: PHP domain-containing protein [Clostridia bacterium]|nr:PHP domain-containing protein [Clostridia bacterium]
MKIIAELHTHSNEFCDHASSSIDEEVEIAKKLGFKYFATTNHGPMSDYGTPVTFYLSNRERRYDGITFLAGIEGDMRDLKGGMDLAEVDLLSLDFVIISLHNDVLETKYPDYTEGLMNVIANPAVDCIGHIGRDQDFHLDLEKVISCVKENDKLIEFNSWSLSGYGKYDSCSHVMDLCEEYGVKCIVTSDAHDADRIGSHQPVLRMLEEKNFPEELVINADETRMADFLKRRRSEKDAALRSLFNE